MADQMVEPYPVGTRVHHRGAIHSVGQKPEHPDGGLRGGWGEVRNRERAVDDTYEYEVHITRGIAGDLKSEPARTWWGSHHINRALPADQQEGEHRG